MTNAEFASHDGDFLSACGKAKITSTRRQASKYRRRRGLAWKTANGVRPSAPRVLRFEADDTLPGLVGLDPVAFGAALLAKRLMRHAAQGERARTDQ